MNPVSGWTTRTDWHFYLLHLFIFLFYHPLRFLVGHGISTRVEIKIIVFLHCAMHSTQRNVQSQAIRLPTRHVHKYLIHHIVNCIQWQNPFRRTCLIGNSTSQPNQTMHPSIHTALWFSILNSMISLQLNNDDEQMVKMVELEYACT